MSKKSNQILALPIILITISLGLAKLIVSLLKEDKQQNNQDHYEKIM